MLKFCSLYSGSSGNSFFVQSKNMNLLVDAGVSGKKIVDALASIHVAILEISAILVTHEHIDHTNAIATLSNKYHLPVYANLKTWNAMSDKKDKMKKENIFYFKNNFPFTLGDVTIFPFDIPHDAANPCGFNISDAESKVSIATDVGHITDSVLEHLKNSNFILLESNYEPDVLKYSSYPYKHLSNENNFPELAYKSVLEQIDHKDLNVNVASRFEPSEFFEVG